MKWYAKKSAGRGQGLVIDEDTGRNVAVAYEEKDAPLLAAAPEMLKALESLASSYKVCVDSMIGAKTWQKVARINLKVTLAAIAKAKGE